MVGREKKNHLCPHFIFVLDMALKCMAVAFILTNAVAAFCVDIFLFILLLMAINVRENV